MLLVLAFLLNSQVWNEYLWMREDVFICIFSVGFGLKNWTFYPHMLRKYNKKQYFPNKKKNACHAWDGARCMAAHKDMIALCPTCLGNAKCVALTSSANFTIFFIFSNVFLLRFRLRTCDIFLLTCKFLFHFFFTKINYIYSFKLIWYIDKCVTSTSNADFTIFFIFSNVFLLRFHLRTCDIFLLTCKYSFQKGWIYEQTHKIYIKLTASMLIA